MAKPDEIPSAGATIEEATKDLKERLLAIAQASMLGLSIRWEPSSTEPGKTEVIITRTKPQDTGK